MPSNERPVYPIRGTSLIRALDVQGVKNLRRLAENRVDAPDDESDYEKKMYALGVLEVLAWLDGASPTDRLADHLKIEKEDHT